VAVGQEIVPFTEEVWPGDTLSFGDTTVTVLWGVGPSGVRHSGYSGGKEDSVSYCFENKDTHFCIGAQGKFVQTEQKIIFSEKNQTVLLKI
jgi:hypothetical protein